jgi:hypothetical protein
LSSISPCSMLQIGSSVIFGCFAGIGVCSPCACWLEALREIRSQTSYRDGGLAEFAWRSGTRNREIFGHLVLRLKRPVPSASPEMTTERLVADLAALARRMALTHLIRVAECSVDGILPKIISRAVVSFQTTHKLADRCSVCNSVALASFFAY